MEKIIIDSNAIIAIQFGIRISIRQISDEWPGDHFAPWAGHKDKATVHYIIEDWTEETTLIGNSSGVRRYYRRPAHYHV